MTWSEHSIARAISLQTLARKCVVLVDNCNWTGHECDVLAVTTDLRIIDVEVKISRADLKADAKKDKWWRSLAFAEASSSGLTPADGSTWSHDMWKVRQPVTHPRKVWKHYYALPAEIWNDTLFDALPSQSSGVLVLRERRNEQVPVLVECVRRATPNKDAHRLTPEEVMDISRLANLRMWEAYKRRDEMVKEMARVREAVPA